MNIFFKTIQTFNQSLHILDFLRHDYSSKYWSKLWTSYIYLFNPKVLFTYLAIQKIFFQLFYPCTHFSTKEKFNIQIFEPLLRHVTDINDINKKPNQHFFTQYTAHDSLNYTSIYSTWLRRIRKLTLNLLS